MRDVIMTCDELVIFKEIPSDELVILKEDLCAHSLTY